MKVMPVLAAAVVMASGSMFFATYAANRPVFPQAGQVAGKSDAGTHLQRLARDAMGDDGVKASEAVASLRADGYAGLEALLSLKVDTPKFREAMDRVAMQKDAWASQLFWHTEMGVAKAEAARTGKPILSLRMLGRLDQDLSCANSRFFRTTLYANSGIGKYLRENFVLHWESVRPVPVITIDMGDGRKIVRTVTGNSIHYVLDSQGRVIDGIPGLYGPKAFLQQLEVAESQARATGGLDDRAFVASARAFHTKRIETMQENWQRDLKRVALGPARATDKVSAETASKSGAYAKRLGEAAIVRQVTAAPAGGATLSAMLPLGDVENDSIPWEKIAALHAEDARLDGESLKLVRAKAPAVPADVAAKITVSKAVIEDPMMRMVRNLQQSIAMDTVKNEYRLHPRIALWLSQENRPVDLKQLNERVYAQLFLTPSTDPWLGLAPADVYCALDNGGVVAAVTKR